VNHIYLVLCVIDALISCHCYIVICIVVLDQIYSCAGVDLA
jgi:hypothetical protein